MHYLFRNTSAELSDNTIAGRVRVVQTVELFIVVKDPE